MVSDNDLLNQPDTVQQPSLMKKNSDRSWTIFSILLIIVHLLFWWVLDILYSNIILDLRVVLQMSPFLLSLAIIDSIAVKSYINKQSPPWKTFFIPLLVFNVMFFFSAWLALSASTGGVTLIVIIPIALILLIIDLFAVFFSIRKQHLHSITRVLATAALIVVGYVLILTAILLVQMVQNLY